MCRLCLNSRDELLIIDLQKIAYFQADRNYTRLTYIEGETHLLTLGLSKIEECIRRAWPAEIPSPFIRLGRSLIINQSYLTGISLLTRKISLSDNGRNTYILSISKPLLKEYKEKINRLYTNNDK